jgi:hypothetical protein
MPGNEPIAYKSTSRQPVAGDLPFAANAVRTISWKYKAKPSLSGNRWQTTIIENVV